MPSKFAGGNFPKADGRNDLGYGRSDPKFHTPKKLGSSVYPYNGYTNPTWTIMTLALRLAKKLIKIR